MISEANRIIDEIGKRDFDFVPKRKNRAVFRTLVIISLCAASVICAVISALIFTK